MDKKSIFSVLIIVLSTGLLTIDKISETIWLTTVSSAITYLLQGMTKKEDRDDE